MWKSGVSVLFLIGIRYASTRPQSPANEDILTLNHLGPLIYGRPSEDSGRQLKEWFENKRPGNAEEQGNYLEGDILFPNSMLRNGLQAQSRRWVNGEVPVEIDSTFSKDSLTKIKDAMREYHTHTCIKFVQRISSDTDYLFISNKNTGCWSSVGRAGGRQELNLQTPGCTVKVGTVMHELMHALGFVHEHTREDRDSFVRILNENVRPGYESDFQKAAAGSTNNFGVQYDYGSILHYSSTAFSKNGQPTISAKQAMGSSQMGQREAFTKNDLNKINLMYNCQNDAKKDQSLSWLDQFSSIWGLQLLPNEIGNADGEEKEDLS